MMSYLKRVANRSAVDALGHGSTSERFRLKNPYDLSELLGRSVGTQFEFVSQYSQNRCFSAGGLDRFLQFASQDIELMAEDQDIEVLIRCGLAAETDEG